MDNARIAKIFKALCDEKRVSIVQLLQNGPNCACKISEELGIAQSKLSYHMKILCESRIIECWYEGKWTYYKISEIGSSVAISVLKDLTVVNNFDKNCDCNKEAI